VNTRRPAKSIAARPGAAEPAGGLKGVPMERLEFIAAAILSVWVLVLHVVWLFDAGPLWRDEVGTIDFAAMPTWADIWNNLQYDNFPPLFVATARAWMAAGFSSDFGCRVLGFLIGVCTAGIFWWNARVFGARAPLLALAFYAIDPLAIRVGDSLRPYGLGIALTALSLGLIWKFVQSPQPKRLLWAAMAAVLSVQCLYQCAFFVMAFCCGAWAATLRNKQWKTAAATAMIGAAAALSLLPHAVNIKKGRDWFGISHFASSFAQIGQLLATVWHGPGGWVAGVWLALVLAAVAIGLFGGIFRRKPMLLFVGTGMVAAMAAYLVFVRFLGLRPRPWYFLILMAAEVLGIEAVFGTVQAARVRMGRIAVALALAVSCAGLSYAGVRMRQSNIDLVAATLEAQAQPQDLVLVSPWYYGVSLQRYLATNSWTTLPPMNEMRIHRYDLMKKQMEAEQPIAPLLAGVERTLRSGHALWVAGMFQFPPQGQPQPILPPYRGAEMEMADAKYFSSWMFQLSQLVQSHASRGEEVPIPTPGNLPINPLENVPVLRFSGWRGE
jgi:hypothetical protein